MENPVRKTLLAAVESTRTQLRQYEAALKAFDAEQVTPIPPSPPESRFAGVRPFDAIVQVLHENHGRMDREHLMDALVAGGATLGKKRGHHNLRISLDLNVKLGKLEIDGSDVVLPPDKP